MQELWITIRTLRKSPGFTLAAILTLAIGIGANTAVFSVVNAVLLHPLPIDDRDRVVFLFQHDKQEKHERGQIAPANYEDLRTLTHSFSQIADFVGSGAEGVAFSDGGQADRVTSAGVSPDLFPLMGAKPVRGRLFTAEESNPPVRTIVISYGLWQRRFGGNEVIGRQVRINGTNVSIIGVMPPEFRFPASVDVWTPLALDQETRHARTFWFLNAMARLKPGVSLARAQADLDAFTANLAKAYPATNATMAFRLEPVEDVLVGDVRPALLVVLGAVGLMMLVACVNLASLLLVRASTRSRESAVRAALGASRRELMRGVLLESMALALAGGLAGLALSQFGTKFLANLAAGQLPRIENLNMDWRVGLFALGLSLITGILFGVLPALQSSRANVADALKASGDRAGVSGASNRLRSRLVAAEIALSLVLLTGAGLLVRSFWQVVQTPAGFNPANLLTLQVDLSGDKYRRAVPVLQYFDRLRESLGRIPGVRNVAFVNRLPLSGLAGPTAWFTIADRPWPAGVTPPEVNWRVSDAAFFPAMGIRLVKGRLFEPADIRGATAVAVINETTAGRFFPNEDPIGRQIYTGPVSPKNKPVTIVGVVSDMRQSKLQENPRPEVYEAHAQSVEGTMNLIVRTDGDPRPLVGSVRAAIAAVDQEQPPYQIRTMQDIVGAAVAPERLYTTLLGIFALFAALLAAIGVYGVLTYSVAQRGREIAIRMALGAQQKDVVRQILSEGLRIVTTGVVAGILVSLATSRLLNGFLYQVPVWDPVTFAVVASLMGGVALLAAWFPALRATQVDPMTALRQD